MRARLCTSRRAPAENPLEQAQQLERRAAIVKILRETSVGRQSDLVRLLRRQGHVATQSSVSRDLRELGVMKAGDRYLLAPGQLDGAQAEFAALAGFVREIQPAGGSLTVVKTATGAAQSVAVALDRAQWPEVVGTISGDDTIFIATRGAAQQQRVLQRLHSVFRI